MDAIMTRAAISAAQEASPLWHSQHLTAAEAARSWRALWAVTAVAFVGTVVLAVANIAGVIQLSQSFAVPAADFDEGSVRALVAGLLAVASGSLQAADAVVFAAAARRARVASAAAAAADAVAGEKFDGNRGAAAAAATAAARVHRGPPPDLLEGDDGALAWAAACLVVLVNVCAGLFGRIEGWTFREAEQWYLASIACIVTAGIVLIGIILAITSNKLVAMLRGWLIRGIQKARARALESKRRRQQRRRDAAAARASAAAAAAAAEAAAAVEEEAIAITGTLSPPKAASLSLDGAGRHASPQPPPAGILHVSDTTNTSTALTSVLVSRAHFGTHDTVHFSTDEGSFGANATGQTASALSFLTSATSAPDLLPVAPAARLRRLSLPGLGGPPPDPPTSASVVVVVEPTPVTSGGAAAIATSSGRRDRVVREFLSDGTLGDSAATSSALVADEDAIVADQDDDDGGFGDGGLGFVGLPLHRSDTVDTTYAAAVDLGYGALSPRMQRRRHNRRPSAANRLPTPRALLARARSASSPVQRVPQPPPPQADSFATYDAVLSPVATAPSAAAHLDDSATTLDVRAAEQLLSQFRHARRAVEAATAAAVAASVAGAALPQPSPHIGGAAAAATSTTAGPRSPFGMGAAAAVATPVSPAMSHQQQQQQRRRRAAGLRRLLWRARDAAEAHADLVSAAALAASALATGAAVLCASEGWVFLDALYFCYSLVTTTGYGDLYPSSAWGRTWVVCLTFASLGVWAYALAAAVARVQAIRVRMRARRIRAVRRFLVSQGRHRRQQLQHRQQHQQQQEQQQPLRRRRRHVASQEEAASMSAAAAAAAAAVVDADDAAAARERAFARPTGPTIFRVSPPNSSLAGPISTAAAQPRASDNARHTASR
ncbi:hypothetical protein HK405_009125 [Cladochytrium tenue]|nr:hypothetical protein HK405_009125 [Cladochytrium tenue]